jgi:hypothetical protein
MVRRIWLTCLSENSILWPRRWCPFSVSISREGDGNLPLEGCALVAPRIEALAEARVGSDRQAHLVRAAARLSPSQLSLQRPASGLIQLSWILSTCLVGFHVADCTGGNTAVLPSSMHALRKYSVRFHLLRLKRDQSAGDDCHPTERSRL